jgi:hypothetical protein
MAVGVVQVQLDLVCLLEKVEMAAPHFLKILEFLQHMELLDLRQVDGLLAVEEPVVDLII